MEPSYRRITARIIILLAVGLCLSSPVMAQSPFTEVTAITDSLTGVSASSVAWGDYDNDGDLDVLVTDWYTGSKIYENDGGTFTAAVTLLGVWDAAAAWGDYDGDGDLDVLLTGYTGSTRYTVLYENSGGAFSTSHYVGTTGLADVEDASVAWGDYDNDGDLDILLSGWTQRGAHRYVYRPVSDARVHQVDQDAFIKVVTGDTRYWILDGTTTAAGVLLK